MKKYEVEISEEAESFLSGLKESTRNKFIKVFSKIELGFISKDDFKKLSGTDSLWEFRVQDNNSWYRVFGFMMRDNEKIITTILVINGYQKKGNRTPKSEIDKALRLKAEYSQS